MRSKGKKNWMLPSLCGLALLAAAWGRAERPHIYALHNLKIVTAPGQVIEQGTVVIRDGRIEAVGADVSVPEDAQVIEGEEGWTVYAAFIDAAAYLGKKASDTKPPSGLSDILASLSKPKPPEKGAPHPIAKIQPHASVIDWLSLKGKDIKKHRKLGFGTAQILNSQGIFRGLSAVINLREGAVRDLVLKDRFAQTLAFEKGGFFGGAYPGSRMGAIAAVRQALLDAQRFHQWRTRYQNQPTAMQRPPFQDSTDALIDVLQGRVPLLFVADNPLSYDRFTELKKELGLGSAMILGTCEEWRDMERVKAAAMPVLLPLNYPKKPELEDEDASRTVSLAGMQAYLNAPTTPALLAAQDIPFAIVTAGTDSLTHFSKNLKKALDEGLSEDQALAALTTTPARLLGLDPVLGTIEAGKIANLLVVKGSVFIEKPEPRYLFVDGIHEKFEDKAGKGDPNAVEDPMGTWEMVTQAMGRSNESTWTISKKGDEYSGYSESEERGKRDFNSVTLEGDTLTVSVSTPMGDMEISLIIKGDEMEGDAEIEIPQMGRTVSLTIKGKRIDKNPRGEGS